MPAVPIRLSVPIAELGWHRHSWLLVPLIVLAVSLVVELVAAAWLGFDGMPDFMLKGIGIAVFVGVLTYTLVRNDMSGLCEVATLYHDRIVLVRDGREISLRWGDLHFVNRGWTMHYWARHPVKLRCRLDGRHVRLCFFPRRDAEFHQWELGSPYEALITLSGYRDRLGIEQAH
jgi:hypothetical protein